MPELTTVLRLEIPSRPGYVSMVRLVVGTAATTRRALSPERVEDLALALSEACTNAIEAHSAAGLAAADLVTVDVAEDAERLVVTVADRGSGFDPMALALPPVDDASRINYPRGLGIPIIRQLVDEVTFQSGDGGTTVRIVMHCPPAPEADLDIIDLDDLGDLEAAWDEE